MNSPYADLPAKAFWRQAVAERLPEDPGEVFSPRFEVTRQTRIMTAGSCFAQHVGRTLREAGFDVIDAEPAPKHMPPDLAARYGFNMFTGRYGNIYTVRQMMQLFDEVFGEGEPADPVWEREGRYFDAQRPNVEPDGHESPEEVMRLRKAHLAALRHAFSEVDLFVFTFGLTEAWTHRESGTVYPTAPGTLAGSYDPEQHVFRNYTFTEILTDFLTLRENLRAIRPDIRFLITTSPVPLTATASGQHVEVASVYSKSILRGVCGELYQRFEDVEYFPSFEIITSQRAGGRYYETNLRSVSSVGVRTAMSVFMNAHGVKMARPETKIVENAKEGAAMRSSLDQFSIPELRQAIRRKKAERSEKSRLSLPEAADATAAHDEDFTDKLELEDDDVVCEDALLEAFSKS